MDEDGRQLGWLRTNSNFCGVTDGVALFEVKMKTLYKKTGLEHRVLGSKFENASYTSTRFVLVIGPTGAGKSTFVNALVNYFVGVEYRDDCRFIVATAPKKGDGNSGTENVTAYTIESLPGFRFRFSLTIVDTPGFGNVEVGKEEENNWSKIQELFKSEEFGLNRLHLVAFVVTSADHRLSARAETAYAKVTSIFGNDVVNNFHIIITHCEIMPKKEIPVLKTLKKAGVPTDFPHYLNFQAVMTKVEDAPQGEVAWRKQRKALQDIRDFLDDDVIPVSLTLTKDNLKKLQFIETKLRELENPITGKDTTRRETHQEFEEKIYTAKKLHETFQEHKTKAMKPYLPYIRKFISILLEEDQVTFRGSCNPAKIENFETYEEALKKVSKILKEMELKGHSRGKGLLSHVRSFFGI
ncbi:unnamed protein product [Darwinula stevensoni]|uniref:AIG1-type G domain-containing protein n=1 Tax=Darwinula stevensoni TaxID=69355 RepID=A0A7R8XEL3_9CRUS|nr:unnamed protein product [Darwinula stevensoni]CAG0894576.1 unnamed protein product [Darwinula stevensoni]